MSSNVIRALLIAAGYWLVAYATMVSGRETGVAAAIWPANALVLGVLVLLGRTTGLLEVAAVGCANAIAHLMIGDDLARAAALGIANCAGIAGPAFLMAYFGVSREQTTSARTITSLFFVSVLGPLPGALIGGGALAFGRPEMAGSVVFTWWLVEAVAMLILTPPFLFWRSASERAAATELRLRMVGQGSRSVRVTEIVLASLALAAAGVLVPLTGQVVLIELSATVLLWFALRFGMYSTALTAAVFSICVVGAAMAGFWPGAEAAPRAAVLMPLQATLALTTLPALLVAAIMSQREHARRQLSADALRLSYALEGANDGLWDWHLPSGASFFSVRACRMFGYEPEEFEPRSHWDALMHPEDLPTAQAAFDAHMRGDTAFYEAEVRCRHRDGRWIWVHDRGKIVERDAAGRALRAVGTYADISERKRLENALEHLATHDALTGLANRGVFERALQRATARADRLGGRLPVFLIDVDHFKAVNDTYGHAAGDALLATIATRLRSAVRTSDLTARLGGDEFAVIASGYSAAEFDMLAERLCAALAEPLVGQGYAIQPTVSIGVAIAGPGAGAGGELVARADRALYAAKRAGRGTWRFFGGAGKVA